MKVSSRIILASLFNKFSFFVPDRRRSAYIGWLGHGNLGDEILFMAYSKLFPKLSLVSYVGPGKVELIETFLCIKNYHSCVLGGGTLIFGSVYLERIKSLLRHRELPLFCLGTGVSNPTFWRSIGKEKNDDLIQDWISLLERFHFVGVRGPDSKKVLELYGLKVPVHVVGDSAISLAKDKFVKKKRNMTIGINFGKTFGAQWGDENVFMDILKHIIRELIEMGFNITLFPVVRSDEETMRSVVSEIRTRVSFCSHWHNFHEFHSQLEKCDLFIGEKLHSVVIAYISRTPAIMLEYRPKCCDFMKSIGFEKFNVKTSDISWYIISDMIKDIYSGLYEYQEQIDETILQYKSLQRRCANQIQDYLLSR